MKFALFSMLLIGTMLFGQAHTATRGLDITVSTAPPPSTALLTNTCPSGSNLVNCSSRASVAVPNGWSILCLNDYESALMVPCVGNGNARSYADTQWNTVQAHGGTHSSRSDYGRQLTGQRHLVTKLPTGHTEVYVSWFEQYESQGMHTGSGTNAYEFEVHTSVAPTGTDKIDWCCAKTAFGGLKADVLSWEPEANYYHNRGISTLDILFDDQWHQWQVHFFASTTDPSNPACLSTAHGGTNGEPTYDGCKDGVLEIWRDATKLADFRNVVLNGTQNFQAEMGVQVGGTYQYLLWLKNATSNAQCTALYNSHGPYVCAETIADPAYSCTFVNNLTWAQTLAETGCTAQFGPLIGHEFYKYVDDVIMLYK